MSEETEYSNSGKEDAKAGKFFIGILSGRKRAGLFRKVRKVFTAFGTALDNFSGLFYYRRVGI